MNPIPTFDVAVIGAGTAGLAAYRAAREHTESVCLIDAGPLGTTCARVGCMPSKLLIAAAEAAQAVREAGRFGVQAAAPQIDGAAVMARVQRERDRFVGFVLDGIEALPAGALWPGQARFVAPGRLEVGARPLQARRVVIATGSAPDLPAAWQERLGDRLLTTDSLFERTTLPRSVAVLGSGVIALELAQALHRLGVRVRVFGRERRLGPLSDPMLQQQALALFGAELSLSLGHGELQPQRVGDEVLLQGERFDYLLAATGRRPRLQALQLQAAGLALDAQGRLAHDPDTGQVPGQPVFVAGDAAAERPLLHEAADEGRRAGHNAGRYPDVQAQPHATPLAIVFSDPQLMRAGASHRELQASGRPFATGRVDFGDQGRSRILGRNQGALHVYAEPGSGRLLGAEMIGPAAEHLGHLLAWALQRGETAAQLLQLPFYHPVIEEGLRTALRGLHPK